ncbi:biotin-dependent carboxyltransferase family protein [Planomicrobium sp. CPCC 101110]|uniref:5-oxoprolinase subunit C family protein n=1 Tax=Planomicrobium sp. CPCC 101110 TaxID=2599619 RepID=UPI0011B7A648|nr:biotin-dependent carboxyltransferase family protein [Planomicrobium sp. CPCC 101110]TWT24898.1 biotin-dependent carboxyltransferase family protein [Planomicrobium sp. CPCC 101110]
MLKIIKSGLQTTVQDLGRYGFQKYGVIASGAMDPYAHRLANLLVGNEENAATLEITLVGPVIEFERDIFIALCGGDLSPKIDGKKVDTWRPLAVKGGSRLSFGAPISGCRCYLAVSGGISVPEVMNSRSTYLRAEIGGFHGRALKADDLVEANPTPAWQLAAFEKASSKETDWKVPAPHYSVEPVVRMMKGRQYDLFDEESQENIFADFFFVSSNSDRMGYRLEGTPLSLEEPAELISEAVAFGSIQVPADGNPIVLLADRQTTGGYPKIGQVASVDLPLVSQLKPGDRLRFEEITLEESQRLWAEQEQKIRQLRISIQLKWEEWK